MPYNKKQCGTVKMNIMVPIIGIIGLVFFGILLVISLYSKAGTGTCIIFGFFCLMSLFMILTVNQKIEYSPSDFTYRDMFGISRKYEYSQVKKIKYGKDVSIYVGHRIILIDELADNGKKFARIAMQYSKNAEIFTDRQSKLFNGNIKSPGEFVFVYVLIGLLPAAFLIWGATACREIKPEKLTVYEGTVSDISFDKTEDDAQRAAIRFDGNADVFFSWGIDSRSPGYASLQNDIAEEKIFKVYYLNNDKTSDGLIKIYQLSCEGKYYISLEDINENNRETRYGIFIGSAIIEGIWLLYVIISSYVMSNADKYPKLIKYFVKSDYILKNKY